MSTIERAFQVALKCTSIEEVRARLKKEGFSHADAHLTDAQIRSDLAPLLKQPQ